jgi:16S rRNA (cytosine967-C5)-methyltransferase
MTSREIAYDVLSRWHPRSPRAARVLDEMFGREELPAAERALATEFVHGIMRRRETLSALLKPHVNRPLAQVEPGALTLLWLGAYQLAMLSGIPTYAVVNETTELARRAGKPQWTGFVNAVLRSLARAVTDEFTDAPAANAIPLASGRFRLVEGKPFPDPADDPQGYFVAAFSMPKWLAERWLARSGQTELMRLGFWFNAPAKLCLRVNTLRTTRENLLDLLREAKIEARPGTLPEAVWLDETAFVQRLPGFEAGWFAVQDESAIAAARLLDLRPGQTVLDLCAAPGGKTTHLAALMNNEGRIVATDVDTARLRRVEESCRRLGVTNVETRAVPRDGVAESETFDRILVDVPCSNTGVLGKRPEVRWRLQPADIVELATLQTRLLRAACEQLAPSGRLVYSTCSIEPEENRAVVDAVLREQNDVTLLSELHHVPGQPADGGYQALIAKTGGQK